MDVGMTREIEYHELFTHSRTQQFIVARVDAYEFNRPCRHMFAVTAAAAGRPIGAGAGSCGAHGWQHATKSAPEMALRHVGHVLPPCAIHFWMHALQNTCAHLVTTGDSHMSMQMEHTPPSSACRRWPTASCFCWAIL